MKVKMHIRVGWDRKRRRQRVVATARPSYQPITTDRGEYLPTVAFAVMLDVPDAMFAQAEQVIATLAIPESAVEIAAEIKQ